MGNGKLSCRRFRVQICKIWQIEDKECGIWLLGLFLTLQLYVNIRFTLQTVVNIEMGVLPDLMQSI